MIYNLLSSIKIKKGKKSVNVLVRKTGFFSKGFGLMFRTKNTKNLLFEFNKDVNKLGTLTSYFVFSPFLAVWLDKNNKVVDARLIKPFVLSIPQKKSFRKIVEVPVNVKNKNIIKFFVGKSRKI